MPRRNWKIVLKTVEKTFRAKIRSSFHFCFSFRRIFLIISILVCRAELVGSSQSVASNYIRCLKVFDILAKVSVRVGDGNKNEGGSLSDWSGIWIDAVLITEVIAVIGVITEATGIGDKGGLWTDKGVFMKFSEVDVGFWELVVVCTVVLVTIKFYFISETGEQSMTFFLINQQTKPELRSAKKLLVATVMGSKRYRAFRRYMNQSYQFWNTSYWFQLHWTVVLVVPEEKLSFLFKEKILDFPFVVIVIFPKLNYKVSKLQYKRYNLWWTGEISLWICPQIFEFFRRAALSNWIELRIKMIVYPE